MSPLSEYDLNVVAHYSARHLPPCLGQAYLAETLTRIHDIHHYFPRDIITNPKRWHVPGSNIPSFGVVGRYPGGPDPSNHEHDEDENGNQGQTPQPPRPSRYAYGYGQRRRSDQASSFCPLGLLPLGVPDPGVDIRVHHIHQKSSDHIHQSEDNDHSL